MRWTLMLLLVFLALFVFQRVQKNFHEPEPSAFELVNYYRVSTQPTIRFDLSGLLKVTPSLRQRFEIQGDFLLINDKSPQIYIATGSDRELIATPWLDLSRSGFKGTFDLEDIDFNGQSLFVVNESDGSLFQIDPPQAKKSRPTIKILRWHHDQKEIELSNKFGIEALGAHENKIILGNEIAPLGLFELHLSQAPGFAPDLSKRAGTGSQTSLRIRNPHVYILDRETECIWKEPLVEGQGKISKLSFKRIIRGPDLDYLVYDGDHQLHNEWGTAEALDLDNDTFYIGTDNNGWGLRANPQETRPSIMVLKLKQGFSSK